MLKRKTWYYIFTFSKSVLICLTLFIKEKDLVFFRNWSCGWKRLLFERIWCTFESSFSQLWPEVSVRAELYSHSNSLLYEKGGHGWMCTALWIWWSALQCEKYNDYFLKQLPFKRLYIDIASIYFWVPSTSTWYLCLIISTLMCLFASVVPWRFQEKGMTNTWLLHQNNHYVLFIEVIGYIHQNSLSGKLYSLQHAMILKM